jgi:branched-chain amino acid transport system ATP-binding protein
MNILEHTDALLTVENVVKDFGGLRAVNRASLSVGKGEIQGLIGPNASGKTTLINLITGIYRVSAGRIYFSGNRIDGLQPHVIASMGIMRTFQVSRVFRDMTLLENMMVPALTQGESIQAAKSRAEELMEFVLLDRLKGQKARYLSGGQTMLLQMALGFMNRRLRLYVMDEPFAGVHQTIKGIIINAIRSMSLKRGISFLIVSHEMTTVNILCHQISVLHKGEVISAGTMKTIANDPLVIEAYLGGS